MRDAFRRREESVVAATVEQDVAGAARRLVEAIGVPEEFLGGRAPTPNTSGDAIRSMADAFRGAFTSTPERAPNPFFEAHTRGYMDMVTRELADQEDRRIVDQLSEMAGRGNVGTEAAVREGRRMGVGVPTLAVDGRMPPPTPPQGFARNMFTPEVAAEAQMRAAEYFRTGARTVTLGQNVQPGDIVGIDRVGRVGVAGTGTDFDGDIVGIATGAGVSGGVGGVYDYNAAATMAAEQTRAFRVRDGAGITVNPWSEVTVARKPSMTMDEAISTLLQKISDALPQNASSEYNDAVSDVLEVVEAFRVTQIEPPKVENSKYQDILRQLGSRVITDIVKEVILAYRYSKLEDKDLLANLKAALNNSLRGRVSENTVVTSVHTHVDNINLQRVVQVRFKLHKDDDLIHTQEISMNVNF